MSKEDTQDLTLQEKIMKIAEEEEAEETANSTEDTSIEASTEENVDEQTASEEESDSEGEDQESDQEKEADSEEAPKDEYVADLTYKVHDEEHKFDEKVNGFIKSKEDEDFFRDLYTRAAGIDVLKPKLEKYREEAQTATEENRGLKSENIQHKQNWNFYNDLVDRGRTGDESALNALLDTFDIPDKVLGEALAKRLEMSPEQHAHRRALAAQAQQKDQIDSRATDLDAREASIEAKEALAEVDATLSNEEFKEVINFVDSKRGVGSFREEVLALGIDLEVRQGKEVTAQEVASQIAEKYRSFMPKAEETSKTEESQTSEKTAEIPKKRVEAKQTNSIPNMGSGNSDISAGPILNSLEDLEKFASDYRLGKN